MGVCIYLYCEKCKEYVHIGKVAGSDFELPYTRMDMFLEKHSARKGCVLITLNDSIEDKLYQRVMDGTEFV